MLKLVRLFILKEVGYHVVRTLKQFYREVHMGGTETSCRQPAQIWELREWATLEMDPLAPVKISNDSAWAGIFTTS